MTHDFQPDYDEMEVRCTACGMPEYLNAASPDCPGALIEEYEGVLRYLADEAEDAPQSGNRTQ